MKSIIASISALLMTLVAMPAFAKAPVTVNAADLIGKVYGVADPGCSESECRREAQARFETLPEVEEGAEWLSSDNGFVLVYEGQSPEVEAMARYERGEVAGYGYIFYFPYEATQRNVANHEQCEFCSALLQELSDMGLTLGSDIDTDSLFDVSGAFSGGDFHLALTEEVASETPGEDLPAGAIPADREGQFVLLISVVPTNAVPMTAANL